MSAPAAVRPLAEVAALIYNAVCGQCWAGHLRLCDLPGPDSVHEARVGRAVRRGVITPADRDRILAAAGLPSAAGPGTAVRLPDGAYRAAGGGR